MSLEKLSTPKEISWQPSLDLDRSDNSGCAKWLINFKVLLYAKCHLWEKSSWKWAKFYSIYSM